MTQRLVTRNRKLHQALGKFHNRKTEIDGIVFDSALEARVYQRLKLRVTCGDIDHLRLQVPFTLLDKFTDGEGRKHLPIVFIADFVYQENGKTVISEAKGKETRVYLMKRKMCLSRYPDVRFEVIRE